MAGDDESIDKTLSPQHAQIETKNSVAADPSPPDVSSEHADSVKPVQRRPAHFNAVSQGEDWSRGETAQFRYQKVRQSPAHQKRQKDHGIRAQGRLFELHRGK